MLIAKLVHNPKAGDKEHSEEHLIKLIESEGFKCNYSSIKEDGWQQIPPDTDMLIVVGGDGTVRKVAKVLLEHDDSKRYFIGLLPFGTANNIAKTLKIDGDVADIVRSWHHERMQAMDAMIISGLPAPNFFIEGYGYGIFPQLMKDMKAVDKKKLDTPEKEIAKALEVLRDIVLNYQAVECAVTVDGESHEGSYLLVEVMNICSIGPNLKLAPDADPSDGILQVAMVPENERQKFADFLQHTIDGNECPPYPYQTLSGKNISIRWEGNDAHADDEIIDLDEPASVSINIKPGALCFLVP